MSLTPEKIFTSKKFERKNWKTSLTCWLFCLLLKTRLNEFNVVRQFLRATLKGPSGSPADKLFCISKRSSGRIHVCGFWAFCKKHLLSQSVSFYCGLSRETWEDAPFEAAQNAKKTVLQDTRCIDMQCLPKRSSFLLHVSGDMRPLKKADPVF